MAASNFDPALALVLSHEGGFTDHPADPGGATKYGITRRTLERARGTPVSVKDVRSLDLREAAAIYRDRYWHAIRADDLPSGIDLAVFDCAVNSGPDRAVRLLQNVLGVEEDGAVGPATLAAADDDDPARVVRRLSRARLSFLRRLAIWPVFRRGWRRRVLAVEREALRLSARPPHSTKKGSSMFDSKSILASRTVWANLVGLSAIVLGAIGFDTSGLDAGAFAEATVQIVTAGSFVASTVFRILATRQLLS